MWTRASLHRRKLHQTPLWLEGVSRLEHWGPMSPVPIPSQAALSPLMSDNVLELEIRETNISKNKVNEVTQQGGPVDADPTHRN